MSVYKRKGENELGEQKVKREEMTNNENIGNVNKVCFVEEPVNITDEDKDNRIEEDCVKVDENSLNALNEGMCKNKEESTIKREKYYKEYCEEYFEENSEKNCEMNNKVYCEEKYEENYDVNCDDYYEENGKVYCEEIDKNMNNCKEYNEKYKVKSYVTGEYFVDKNKSNLLGEDYEDIEKYESYNIGEDSRMLVDKTKRNMQKIKNILLDVQKKRSESNEQINDYENRLIKLRGEYYANKRAFERSKNYMSTDLQLVNKIILSFEKRVYFDEELTINPRFDRNNIGKKNKFCNSFDVSYDSVEDRYVDTRTMNKNAMYNSCSNLSERKKMYRNTIEKEDMYYNLNDNNFNRGTYKSVPEFGIFESKTRENECKSTNYENNNGKDEIRKKIINNEMNRKMFEKQKNAGIAYEERSNNEKMKNIYHGMEYVIRNHNERSYGERKKQYESMNCKSYSRDLINYKTKNYISMNTQMFENNARNFLFVPVISNSSQNEMYSHKDKSKSVDWVQAINEVEDKENGAYGFNGEKKDKYRPYKCTLQGCDKSYTSLYGLKYHKEHGHSKIEDESTKPFKCEAFGCNKRYKNANGLKYHIENGHKF